MNLTHIRAGAFVLGLILPTLALAQSTPVYQSGRMIAPHNVAKITRNGQIQDGGGMQGDASGRGVNPFRILDVLGLGICSDSAAQSGTYSALCLGHDSSGNGILSLTMFGAGTPSFTITAPNALTVTAGSIAFSPTPTAPTPTAGDSSTKLATTAFVTGQIGAAGVAPVPVVANNTALAALAQATTTRVLRLGYAAQGDTPPLVFVGETGTCTANARVNDGGSCVNSGDGNSWYASFPPTGIDPRWFGCKADGSTDCQPAIQAAVNLGQPVYIAPPSNTQTLFTSATSAIASNVLTFTSVPSTIVAGMAVTDNTYSAHLPLGVSVQSTTGTTVTLTQNIINGGVAIGEAFTFAMPYLVGSPVVITNNTVIQGGGRESSILKLKTNACSDVIQGLSAYSLFAAVGDSKAYSQSVGSSLGGAHNWRLSDFTIDGNYDNNLGCGSPDAVNGIAVYGAAWWLTNMEIINVRGHGIRSEWINGTGELAHGTEPHVRALDINRTGRHNWWNKGPHDCDCTGVIVGDASQETDNTWDGVGALGPLNTGSGVWTNFHGYHYSEATNRARFQFNDSGGSQFSGSSFEGARHQYHLQPGAATVHSGSYFYGGQFQAAGTAMAVIESTLSSFSGIAALGVAGSNLYAFQFGCTGASTTLGCQGNNSTPYNALTGGVFTNFDVTSPFNFANGGVNIIVSGTGWSANGGGATTFGGTVDGSVDVQYEQAGTVITNSKSYTPTISGGTTAGTPTYTSQFGSYQKNGRLITAHFGVTITAKTGMVGIPLISLPFASALVGNDNGACWFDFSSGVTLAAGYTDLKGFISPGTSTVALVKWLSGATTAFVDISEIGAATTLDGTCVYHN